MYQPNVQFTPKDPLVAVPCPLCGVGAKHTVLARRGFPDDLPLTNVICEGCGLIRITPRMSAADYERFYQQAFFDYLDPMHRPAYVQEIEGTKDNTQTWTKTTLIPFMEAYIPTGGRVLDVGAGFGQALYLLKQLKQIEAIGLEPDPGSRQIASDKIGIGLLDEMIETYLPRTTELYDFVILNQVFEHLMEPLTTLQQLAARLTPNGAIYIGVPNAYNPLCSMSLFYQMAHTFNYTPYTLSLFAERAGLKIVKMQPALAGALEVIMAKKDSAYPALPPKDLAYGSSWKEVRRRLQHKRLWNVLRGNAKNLLGMLLPQAVVQGIRAKIDRVIRYRY